MMAIFGWNFCKQLILLYLFVLFNIQEKCSKEMNFFKAKPFAFQRPTNSIIPCQFPSYFRVQRSHKRVNFCVLCSLKRNIFRSHVSVKLKKTLKRWLGKSICKANKCSVVRFEICETNLTTRSRTEVYWK